MFVDGIDRTVLLNRIYNFMILIIMILGFAIEGPETATREGVVNESLKFLSKL
jgi:hypothetical protein